MGLTVTNLVFIGLVELDLKSNKAIIDKKKHLVKVLWAVLRVSQCLDQVYKLPTVVNASTSPVLEAHHTFTRPEAPCPTS